MPLLDQALGLGAGLLTAYVTGTWRKYGHRLERLYELRQALPDDAVVLRAEFDRQSQEEAKRLIGRGLVRPPTRIVVARLALRSVTTLWVVLVVVAVAGSRPWVALGREVGRLQLESRRPGQLPLWALITYEAIVFASIPVALVSGANVVEYWYSRLATPTRHQRGLYWVANLGLGLVMTFILFTIGNFYDKGLSATTKTLDGLLPPLWLRLLIFFPVAGLVARRAWRLRRRRP